MKSAAMPTGDSQNVVAQNVAAQKERLRKGMWRFSSF